MLTPTCLCGQPMTFKPGENKTYCKAPGCGVVQEKRPEGYWAYGLSRIAFTPILTKQKLNHYQRYMRWRNRGRAGNYVR
ncbi:hypothetical protein [Desulfosporosinus sp. SB140]|uniref:hypothetical protein n=1 Tax=Desulfosporosinus paludis TaxID=3115649 RepID=UPI00388D7CE5